MLVEALPKWMVLWEAEIARKGIFVCVEMVCREIHSSHMASAAPQSAALTAKKNKPKMPSSSSVHRETQMTHHVILAGIPHLSPKKGRSNSGISQKESLRIYVNVKWVIPTHLQIRLERVVSWWTNPYFQTPFPCQRNSTGQARTNPTSNETCFRVFRLWNKPRVKGGTLGLGPPWQMESMGWVVKIICGLSACIL